MSKHLKVIYKSCYICIQLPRGELMINLNDYFPEQFKSRLVLINHQSANQRIVLNHNTVDPGITISDGFHSHVYLSLGSKTIQYLVKDILEAYADSKEENSNRDDKVV